MFAVHSRIKCINYQQHKKFANESAWLPFGHGTYLERPYMLLPIQASMPWSYFFSCPGQALGGLRLFGGVKTQGYADSTYPCPFLKAAEIPLNLGILR